MGPLLKLARAHLQALADAVIPYVLDEYAQYQARRAKPLFAVAKQIPLPALDAIVEHHTLHFVRDMEPHLQRAFRRNGYHVLRQFRLGAELHALVDYRAVAYARDRAGALIKDFGASTPAMVKESVVRALENSWSVGQLRDDLRENQAFSPVRALNIARTEPMQALRAGGLEAAKAAQAKLKSWDSDAGACERCRTNSDAGWIPIDDTFPEGDEIHPSCTCSISYSLGE